MGNGGLLIVAGLVALFILDRGLGGNVVPAFQTLIGKGSAPLGGWAPSAGVPGPPSAGSWGGPSGTVPPVGGYNPSQPPIGQPWQGGPAGGVW